LVFTYASLDDGRPVRATDPERAIRLVGARVAESRRAAGLTQEALAERLSISSKYLQRVEAGLENLTLRSLVALANAVDVAPRDLLLKPRNAAPTRPGRPRKRRV
jgi:transcriptional regulator with XRE-family HTH domain